jgi:hypothetical protein
MHGSPLSVARGDTPSAVPVVLFAYARPRLLGRTLECLRSNGVPRIYAYSDGPKTPEMAAAVAEVRQILRAVDWCQISIVERPANLGLGQSIRTGVTEVLTRHEAVIVFEEDLVCVDGTYRYLSAALERYKDEPKVMSVTGWTHPRITPAGSGDRPFFDGRGESLVWGTWRRAWRGMEEDAMTLVRRCEERRVDPYAYGADLMDMARMERERNIWAVRFLYLHIVNGGLCLRPPRSLVEHIGDGADATNAPDFGSQWANPPLQPCPPIPTVWPDPVEHPQCRALAAMAYESRPEPPSVGRRLRESLKRRMPDTLLRAYRRVKMNRLVSLTPEGRRPH